MQTEELAIYTKMYNDTIELFIHFLDNARGTSYSNALGEGDYTDLTDEEWAEQAAPYIEHLNTVLNYDWPEEFDLTPIQEALAAHQN